MRSVRWVLTVCCGMLCACLLWSCASIIHGSKQKVSFQSTPSAATVMVWDEVGISQGKCETPCQLELRRKNKYKVHLEKAGYAPADMAIQKGTSGWVFGNILFGGIIGLIVDFSNGAAYKLTPEVVQASLSQTTTMQDKDENTLIFVDFEQLLPEEQERVRELSSARVHLDELIEQ